MDTRISRKISKKNKDIIVQLQNRQCANSPCNPAVGLKGYQCLLWKYQGGYFDESEYEFDHKKEFCKGGHNNVENIQALCPNCHSVKTKRFMKQKGSKFTSEEIDFGRAHMEIDSEPVKKKRKL